MKALDVALIALNAALYAAIGYLLYVILPIAAPGLGAVRFWPAAVIPAVFAVVFGARVGSIGAGIGIFISDMLIHGNPLLSLMAGVPSNLLMFAVIGYVSKKNINWKLPLLGLGGISALLLAITYFLISDSPYGFEYQLLAAGITVASYVILVGIVVLTKKWRSYALGSMLGLLAGASIIASMVPLFTEFFVLPGASAIAPIGVTGGLIYLVWTFATEIPFLLLAGPPIIEAVYRAFPNFRREKVTSEQH